MTLTVKRIDDWEPQGAHIVDFAHDNAEGLKRREDDPTHQQSKRLRQQAGRFRALPRKK
jgi:hypothetical protein